MSTVVCGRCGGRNAADAQFCGACGAFLEWEAETPQPESAPAPADVSVPAGGPGSGPGPGPGSGSQPAVGGGQATVGGGQPVRSSPVPAESGTASATHNPTVPVAEAVPPPTQPGVPAVVQPGEVKTRPRRVVDDEPRPLAPGERPCQRCGAGNDPVRQFRRSCGTPPDRAPVQARPSGWPRLWARADG